MAISKYTKPSVVTAILNLYANATNIVMVAAVNNPVSVANINSNTDCTKLLELSGITPGIGNGDYTETTDTGDPCLATPASGQILAVGTGTPTCIVLHDGTDILHIKTYSGGAVTQNELCQFDSFNIVIR